MTLTLPVIKDLEASKVQVESEKARLHSIQITSFSLRIFVALGLTEYLSLINGQQEVSELVKHHKCLN